MILFFIFILISITPLSLHAEERFLPSFRSSVVTNDGKPILRGGGPEPEEEEEQPVKDKSEVSGEHTNARHDSSRAMVEDLNVFIDYLINNYGYEIDKQTRRSDDNDAGPLEEEFRSSKKKRKSKSKKNKQDKHKGSTHGKNKHKLHKKKDMKSTENSNLENDFNLSNERLRNDNNNNFNGDMGPSNNKKFKFNAEASNREYDERNNFVNNFNGNMKSENYESTNNDGEQTIEASINLMDIVDVIRNKIGSFAQQVETPAPEILRMPTDDSEPKNNFSIAFSVQI